jgi:hypothetical protein
MLFWEWALLRKSKSIVQFGLHLTLHAHQILVAEDTLIQQLFL